MKAAEILNKGMEAIGDRASERDQDEERSMARAVSTFNAMRSKDLSEEDGWWFMVCLKAARAFQGNVQMDDYVDGAAYVALAGECTVPHDKSVIFGEWVKWSGGICPVSYDANVQVQLRGRGLIKGTANEFGWKWDVSDPEGDIIRYRAITVVE